MSKKEDAQEALLRQQKQVEIERKVAEIAVAIASSPVQYARRMLAAEVAQVRQHCLTVLAGQCYRNAVLRACDERKMARYVCGVKLGSQCVSGDFCRHCPGLSYTSSVCSMPAVSVSTHSTPYPSHAPHSAPCGVGSS